MTLWTTVHQAPPSMGFLRQEYWGGLPFPSPGDLTNPGIESTFLESPALAGRFFTTEQIRKADKDNSVQFSSVTQLCITLCDPMECRTPGIPVHHQLSELAQTHVHRVGDAIKSSHPLLSLSPPAFNLSQHQGFFQWVSSSHQVTKVLEFQLQLQSFQWLFRTDFI